MTDETRSIELEIDVAGTPEEVWRAIATGPGITSWYVPHTVEEHEGGAASASFGPGPEMTIPGRVAAWEPPERIVFVGADDAGGGLAFEWLVEARDQGTCVVRLVNTGFATGAEWDDQYDGMVEGWKLFLFNLKLHLEHFRGQTATPVLPMAMWAGPRSETWPTLLAALGLPAQPAVGDRVATSGAVPPLGGTVLVADSWRLALLLDQPVPGTAFIAAEGVGDQVGVSVWSYLYGDEGAAAAERDEPRWRSWLEARAVEAPTS